MEAFRSRERERRKVRAPRSVKNMTVAEKFSDASQSVTRSRNIPDYLIHAFRALLGPQKITFILYLLHRTREKGEEKKKASQARALCSWCPQFRPLAYPRPACSLAYSHP